MKDFAYSFKVHLNKEITKKISDTYDLINIIYINRIEIHNYKLNRLGIKSKAIG